MPVIKLQIRICAPPERVFDLARCIDLHTSSMSKFNEKAISGTTSGLISLGEEITWEATHFGIRQRLTSIITDFHKPVYFQDKMTKGVFKSFVHDHFFEADGSYTVMRDVFDYVSPLGLLGKLADAMFLERYLKEMLIERNDLIKATAESEDWRSFLE